MSMRVHANTPHTHKPGTGRPPTVLHRGVSPGRDRVVPVAQAEAALRSHLPRDRQHGLEP